MEAILAGVFILAIYLIYRSGTKPPKRYPVAQDIDEDSDATVRFTDNQYICMCCADFEKPVYGENPSFMHAQMPNDAHCFHISTVKSLEKRGYLVSDGNGGYLKTKSGHDALHRCGQLNPKR